jgi:hypothetical protein
MAPALQQLVFANGTRFWKPPGATMSTLQLLVMVGVVVSWKTLQATTSSSEAIRADGVSWVL